MDILLGTWNVRSLYRVGALMSCMEEERGVHKVLVAKPEGKRPFGRPRRRWEDNIKMNLQEVGRGCGD